MVAGAEGRDRWGVTAKKYGISFRAEENVLELVVVVAQPCEYIKSHRIVHSKMVNSVACDVNLNLKRNSVLAR